MVATVNESYSFDVNVQESGADEQNVLIYGWNVQETLIVNQTTDVNGDIPTQQVEVKQYDDDGVTPTTTIRTPIKVRALKFGFFFREQELVPDSATKATFFLVANSVLTESVQATIDAYTGITWNDAGDQVTLDNTGITPVNNVARLYDFTHSRYSKAATPPQFDWFEVIGSQDGQNFVYDYDIVLSGAGFEFDGQNRSFLRSNVDAQWACFGGAKPKDVTVDFLALSTGSAGNTFNNVNVSDTLFFLENGTYTWSGGNLNNIDLFGAATAVTLNLTNGASVTGTIDPGITVVNAKSLTITNIIVGSEVRIYDDPAGHGPNADLDGVESIGTSTFVYTHDGTPNDIIIQIIEPGYVEINQPFSITNNDQSYVADQQPETN